MVTPVHIAQIIVLDVTHQVAWNALPDLLSKTNNASHLQLLQDPLVSHKLVRLSSARQDADSAMSIARIIMSAFLQAQALLLLMASFINVMITVKLAPRFLIVMEHTLFAYLATVDPALLTEAALNALGYTPLDVVKEIKPTQKPVSLAILLPMVHVKLVDLTVSLVMVVEKVTAITVDA